MARRLLNEFRIQYATRSSVACARLAGGIRDRPSAFASVANFGGPIAGNADAGFGFTENIFQTIDNVTYIRGNHAYKVGFSGQWVSDTRTQTQFQLYTFRAIDATRLR